MPFALMNEGPHSSVDMAPDQQLAGASRNARHQFPPGGGLNIAFSAGILRCAGGSMQGRETDGLDLGQ